MIRFDVNSPISVISGIGKTREKSFAALGIFTLGDLLFHFPRSYQNRGDVKLLSDTQFVADDIEENENMNQPSSYILTVASEPQVSQMRGNRNMNLLKFRAFDESGSCLITFFNQIHLKNTFHTGSEFRFYGRVTRERGGYQMNSPSFEPYVEGIPLPEFVPVYPLSAGLTQKFVASSVSAAIKLILAAIPDHLPEEIREKFGLCSFSYAINNIHSPPDYNSLDTAVRRLAFDELFIFALSLCASKKSIKVPAAPKMSDTELEPFLSLLPYKLTRAQAKAVDDIIFDMSCHYGENDEQKKFVLPMSRILVGDVGCGKTVCAAAASYIAVKNGYQTAIMAPTEILASQHYNELAPMFEKLGINCVLLTGSLTPKRKKMICDMILNGENTIDGYKKIDIVIGTHALIEEKVKFSNLGLVITDEQHRFGVFQRAALAEKAENTHVLVMSATPIPRTLSLIMYGDLDISLIDEMPPGRQRVDTYVVDERYRQRLNAFIRRHVSEGHQVYIVCPSVDESKPKDSEEENEGLTISELRNFELNKQKSSQIKIDEQTQNNQPPLKSAVKYAEELSGIFPDLRVGFVHGKLPSAEKERVMSEFCKGEIDILVSTTVIEVGVNVPNATLMIVENAERFGLSQLHQLRGRVGRGKAKSYCVLVSESKSEVSLERLNVMKTTYDGYTIAEKDLAIRGPGDLFGADGATEIRQHGSLKFKLAGANTDTELLNGAFESARELLKLDPQLNNYPMLRKKLKMNSQFEQIP